MKFKFPALFSAKPRRIGPVPEINVPDTIPDHHRKFCGDSAKEPRLVRIVTDRQTDRLLRHSPTSHTQLPCRLYPCAPPKSLRRRMAIFVTTFPSLRSGNDKSQKTLQASNFCGGHGTTRTLPSTTGSSGCPSAAWFGSSLSQVKPTAANVTSFTITS